MVGSFLVSVFSSLLFLCFFLIREGLLFLSQHKSAYLNGEIEEEVYIELPDGYKQGDKVGRLNKAIYGTR